MTEHPAVMMERLLQEKHNLILDNERLKMELNAAMKPKDNVVVHAGVSSNLYPQGPTFHWRDGWMFARGEGMTVQIWNTDWNPNNLKSPPVAITIPDTEWDSIVGFLSYPKAPPTPNNDPEKAAWHSADTGPINDS